MKELNDFILINFDESINNQESESTGLSKVAFHFQCGRS